MKLYYNMEKYSKLIDEHFKDLSPEEKEVILDIVKNFKKETGVEPKGFYIEKDHSWYEELLDLYNKGEFDTCKEKLEYYKKNNPEYNTDILEFNLMLRDGKHSSMECYSWLYQQKNAREQKFYEEHGFRLNDDFNYLYPELICLADFDRHEKEDTKF